ncbi:hypothetical protein DAEQUDRAFT_386824 [Daedalea quercina L-15889]|uniref:F-box domain-containing protein n=1 Tax=Daedalea quercina L-15889 TaxID=1314783 RepID=A0A165NXF7_9APHY|nr:hypothetical protein DAEQUDRAFT_386824 [Daedalea quercina L-15889]
MLPQLPVEIWERIIDHLWNYAGDLIRCTKVCKAWHSRSLFHLLTLMRLTNMQATRYIVKLLNREPKARAMVNEVLVRGTGPGPECRPIPHLGTLTLMLGKKKIPRLETFIIRRAEWQSGALHRDFFLHLSHFATIPDLHLVNVIFPSKLVFARLIRALPNLTQLYCTHVTFRSQAFDPSAFLSTPTQIKTVRLDGHSNDVAELMACQVPSITDGMEEFQAGWSIYTEERPYLFPTNDAAIISMLQHPRPALKVVNIRLRRQPGVAVQQKHEGEISTSTGAPRLPLLNQCTELEVFRICHCLTKLVESPTDAQASSPQPSSWLYDILASITSTKLNTLCISLDFRYIRPTDSTHVVELAQRFLEQQECTQIDEMLADTERFKGLRAVDIDCLCGTSARTLAPSQDKWTATIVAYFPQLHTRMILGGNVNIKMDY